MNWGISFPYYLQPRARDRRGDRREALALQRQGLRPRRSQLAAARILAQPGAAADAGRLRSARLRALDLVMEFLVGPRSDAAAAEPLLGVDCRNRKKQSQALVFSPSRFLDDAYSIRRRLKEMTFSAAFRCVQAWLLEKPAAWADEDATGGLLSRGRPTARLAAARSCKVV